MEFSNQQIQKLLRIHLISTLNIYLKVLIESMEIIEKKLLSQTKKRKFGFLIHSSGLNLAFLSKEFKEIKEEIQKYEKSKKID